MWPQLQSTLAWWQWIILAVIPPAIVALYFLKLKRRPVEVSSTLLWRKTVDDFRVNSLWQRLRRSLLLWLQLLAAALIALALLRPGWRGVGLSAGRLVILIDNSASMQATDVRPSRLDEAKRRAAELIDQLDDQVAMLISFSDVARVEQPFTSDRAALRRRLAAIGPSQRRTSLTEALQLAAGLASSARSAVDRDEQNAPARRTRLVVLSDGQFEAAAGVPLGELDPVFVPIVAPLARNLAITAFSVERQPQQPDRLQAFAQVANFSADDAVVEVELSRVADSKAIAADRLAIPAGKTHSLTFELGALSAGALQLKINAADDLAADNEAWAAINPPQRARVLLATPGNEPLRLALSTGPARRWASLESAGPERLRDADLDRRAQAGYYDWVIYDRCRPPQMPAANTLFLGILPPDGRWKAGPRRDVPQIIDAATAHPLMRGVDMNGVVIAAAAALTPPQGSRVLVDSDAGPLLAIGPRDGWEDLVLAFPLLSAGAGDAASGPAYETNWPLRPSFPAFVLNALEYLSQSDRNRTAVSLPVGQPILWRTDRAQGNLAVEAPSGVVTELSPTRLGEFVYPATETPGVYVLRSGQEMAARVAVNVCDRAESDIRPRKSLAIRIGCVELAASSVWEPTRREIWRFLLGGTLAVLVLEWYIYSQRVSCEPRRWGLRRRAVGLDST